MERITRDWINAHPVHEHQRAKKPADIAHLVSEMQHGRFLDGLASNPLRLDAEGKLLDGQNRIIAMELANKVGKYTMPVVYNCTLEDVAIATDNGVNRNIVDRAKMMRRGEYDPLSHTITHYAFSSRRELRDKDPVVWLARYDRIKDGVVPMLEVITKRGGARLRVKDAGVPILAGICARAIANGWDKELVVAFAEAVMSGQLPSACQVPVRVRELLIEYRNAMAHDAFRAAFAYEVQQALLDWKSDSRKRTAYRLPIITVEEDGVPKQKLNPQVKDLIPVPRVRARDGIEL